MNREDLYDNVVQSIVKWINDFRKDVAPTAGYVNWDAHADLSELPQGSLIGPAGISLTIEDASYPVVFSVGICTENDPNLFELTKLVSKAQGRLSPLTKMTVYDHDTAQPASWIVTTTPQSVLPVSKAESRNVQFINITAQLELGATSSLR